MVKHIVLWKLKEELSTDEKAKVKREIKEGLEELKEKIKELGMAKIKPYMAERICYDYEF